jgi:repressor LexA
MRLSRGMNLEDLAEILDTTKQTVSRYENGERKANQDILFQLSDVFNVSVDEFFPNKEDKEANVIKEASSRYGSDDLTKLPIVGAISCGAGVVAFEEIQGYESTPKEWLNGGEYFYLRAKGDSMINARIQEGDLLLIRRQDDVESGEIAAVYIDGDAVLKRVYKNNETVILQSENPNYQPIILDGKKDNRIIGKLKKVVMNF